MMSSYKIESMTSETIATSSYWAATYAEQDDGEAPILRCVVEPADLIGWYQDSNCEQRLAFGNVQFGAHDNVAFFPVRLTGKDGLMTGRAPQLPLAGGGFVDEDGIRRDLSGNALPGSVTAEQVYQAQVLSARMDREIANALAKAILTPVSCSCAYCTR